MTIDVTLFQPSQHFTFAAGAGSAAATQTVTQNLNNVLYSTPLQKIRLYNASNGVAFYQWGGTGVVATSTTGYPVGAGLTDLVHMGNACTGVSVILSTGTGNCYASVG